MALSIETARKLLRRQQDNLHGAINKKAPHKSGELKDLKRMRPQKGPQTMDQNLKVVLTKPLKAFMPSSS